MKRYKNKDQKGFTLIELLVVVAIIALLTSIAMVALISARQKSRNAKRISDMTQMANALELFFAANKGYPTGTNTSLGIYGVPQGVVPQFASTLPTAPQPPDDVCVGLVHNNDGCTASDPNCANVQQNTYYYVAVGTPYQLGGTWYYPDYAYYFCLGHQTGDFPPGPKVITPRGIR